MTPGLRTDWFRFQRRPSSTCVSLSTVWWVLRNLSENCRAVGVFFWILHYPRHPVIPPEVNGVLGMFLGSKYRTSKGVWMSRVIELCHFSPLKLLLMEEILHQLLGSLYHYIFGVLYTFQAQNYVHQLKNTSSDRKVE